jgi:hypothetical protein
MKGKEIKRQRETRAISQWQLLPSLQKEGERERDQRESGMMSGFGALRCSLLLCNREE